MNHLNRNLLHGEFNPGAGVRVGPAARFPERVLQFGEGRFLRAFCEWMINAMNARGLFNGSVVVVQPLPQGQADTLNSQDGLYTVILRGMDGGRLVESREIITAVSRAIDPYTHWQAYLECADNPDLRFVISNTTEAGIAYVEQPPPVAACPASFPAKLTALLHRRFLRFNAAAERGMIILPCELSDRNGDVLRQCVLRHARDWRLGDAFIRWIEQHNAFLNTLVDRIVTGYPHAEAESFARELGYDDRLLDAAEIFHLWVIEGEHDGSPLQVIEGDRRFSSELPFAEAGLNVVWTDDLEPYRTRKVRVLNGAHTALAAAGFLAGKATTRECVDDPILGEYVRRAVFDEILPGIDLPRAETAGYARAVIERFRNPCINHLLLDIAENSTSKFRVRVLPSLRAYAERTGTPPPVLTFSLAALIAFYRSTVFDGNALQCTRDGLAYRVRDDRGALAFFAECWGSFDADPQPDALARRVLARTELWGGDLTAIHGLAPAVAGHLRTILSGGVRAAVTRLIEGRP
ncbi:MAG TPA: tagaturonate reductase [Planctomycetota bacterium]|nr:tagaturonate reductase [Planctomycetota bacterium]